MTTQLHRSSPKCRRHLSDEDVRRILAICDQDSNKKNLSDMVRILANTGLRVSELRNLTWARVDFANSRIKVVSSKSLCDRCLPIGPKTIQVLKMRHDREPAGLVFGEATQSLFNRVSGQLRAAGQQIGISHLSFNVLRHTFFTRLANSGVYMSTLMAVGGWTRPRSLMKSLLTPAQECKCTAIDMSRLEEL